MYKDIHNCHLIDSFTSKLTIITYIKHVFTCAGFFFYMIWYDVVKYENSQCIDTTMHSMWLVYTGFELFIYGEWPNTGTTCTCTVIVNLI